MINWINNWPANITCNSLWFWKGYGLENFVQNDQIKSFISWIFFVIYYVIVNEWMNEWIKARKN